MIKKILIFISIICPTLAAASTFTATQNLSFGTLIPVTTSGSVPVSTAGTLTQGSVVTVAPSGTGASNGVAVYHGTGLSAVLEVLTITFLQTSVTLTNGTGGTVTVNNFVRAPASLQIGLFSPDSTVRFGGTMNFTAASTPGNYTGSVQIRGNSLLSGQATVTLPIILTLWKPLSVSQTTQLNFGRIEVLTGNSVIAINAQTGARSVISGGGGINLPVSFPGNAGVLSVTGNPNSTVTITLPTSTTLTGPGTAMTVNNFTRFPATTPTTSLGATGVLPLQIGARLNINTAQAAGTYNGTYNVTINY